MTNRTSVCLTLSTIALILIVALIDRPSPIDPGPRLEDRQAKILDLIWKLESDRQLDVPDGQHGEIGPLQITEAYFLDALQFEPRLQGHHYYECRELAFAKEVVAAYMRRWVPTAWQTAEAETIFRTHNGGPRGKSKNATLRYWEKARSLLGR